MKTLARSIASRRFIPVLALLSLAACGGGHDDAPRDTTPEAQRPQDTRLFSAVSSSTTFAAMSGVPETDRWAGVYKGSAYQIELPKNWNGMLVMYAHGYAGTGQALTVAPPAIRRYLVSQGYAWAASSYSKNYYDVRAGVEDTNALALAFNELARTNGRAVSAPSKIYITGVSMGGHVTAAAVDEENIRTANNKVRYAGAVPMCGVLGDTELYDYFAAYQVAAQQEAGMPATAFPTADWATVGPQVQARLFTSFPGGSTPTAAAVPSAQGLRLKNIVQNLTGGTRPLFDFAYAGPLQATAWGVFGRDGKLQGILNDDVISTQNIVYQFDNNATLTADEQAFNAAIFRVNPTPDANRPRRDGLRWVPKTNAQIRVPVVTMHTLGDLYVPFSMEQIYKRRANALGTSGFLVQRAIRGISHCDFTVAEQVAAFDAMVKWEQQGVKPAGDDVLTPAVVADPNYGCKFTDNTTGPDDSAATARTRASLPKCSGT